MSYGAKYKQAITNVDHESDERAIFSFSGEPYRESGAYCGSHRDYLESIIELVTAVFY
jgi:hypothetical protein